MVIAHKKGRWIEELGIKEKDFHVIEYDENYFLLRIPDSTLFEIDRLTRDRILAELKPTKKNREILRKHDPKIILEIEKELKKILSAEEGKIPKRKGREKIDTIALNVSAICNLRCSYCYADFGSFRQEMGLMQRETALRTIKFFTLKLKKSDGFHIHFFGGEPLMNFKLIEKIIDYTKTIKKKRGISFIFSVVTNGTLFEKRIVRFLKKNRFGVTISIDGLRKFHDSNRIYPDGRGSYASILKGLKCIEHNSGLKYLCARVTVSKNDFDFVGSYRKLINLGFSKVLFTPRVTYSQGKVKSASWNVLQRGMKELYWHCIEQLKKGKDIFRTIDNFTYVTDRMERNLKPKGQCRAGVSYLGVDLKGAFWLCHRFTGIKGFKVGNFSEGIKGLKLMSSVDENPTCSECWARYLCGGGCYFENYCASGNLHNQIRSFCDYSKDLIRYAVLLYVKGESSKTGKKPESNLSRPYL